MKNLGNNAEVLELRARLLTLAPGDVRRWGTLSVEEMMAHVREAYLAAGTEPGVALMKTPLPPPVMRYFALRFPMRWPRGIPTVPSLRREAMPPPEAFGLERERLLAAFELFVQQAAERAEHPIFGSMTPWHWRRWGYLHADHHLRQFGR